MYVVRYVQGAAARRDVDALAPARSLVSLNAEQIALTVLAGLEPLLGSRPPLRSVTTSVVKRWVAAEVRFVADVRNDKAVARFCERESEHAHEFAQFVATMFAQILDELPEYSRTRGRLVWDVTLVNFISAAPVLVQQIVSALVARNFDSGHLRLGASSARGVVDNLLRASRLTEDEARKRPKSVVWPIDSSHSSFEQVRTYLHGTPVAEFLLHPVTVNMARQLVD